MFGKKVHGDIKKSAQKIGDFKKDSVTRYKHLRNVLEHIDINDEKSFFEVHYSNIYHIFYDNFVIAEANLKQKVHKTHKEELDNVLGVLEKILTFCPELISNRWQCHSIRRVLTKLLHPANSWKLRREAIKFFVIWYQTLQENAPDIAHAMFATIVPGFPCPIDGYEGLDVLNKSSSVANSPNDGPISCADIHPVYPPPSGEKPQEDQMKFFLDSLLEFMVTQVSRIRWRDSCNEKRRRCFIFLFEKFKQYYLPVIFRNYSDKTSVYKPVSELPELRYAVRSDKYLLCRVAVIRWIANFTHDIKHKSSVGTIPSGLLPKQPVTMNQNNEQGIFKNATNSEDNIVAQNPEDVFCLSFQVVRDVLFLNRENVNLVLEIFRQAYLLPFSCSPAIRRTIAVYKDWIQKSVVEIPAFMLEPVNRKESIESESNVKSEDIINKPIRLRNDSYVGAIALENYHVRAGLQNVLQLFISHAANVFLLETSSESAQLLEEQVDICKRVLNLYRYMVMHTHMEMKTWEQLLLTLLKITSTILSSTPPRRKDEKLGGKLAPAVFQTLIVTWIKANLNVVICAELWDRFCEVLSSLTQWEELIKEWAKTMETLTRVLARHVYHLDLSDLPLDRLTEQKAKRKKGFATRKIITICNDIEIKKHEENTVNRVIETESGEVNEQSYEHKRIHPFNLRRSRSDTNVSYDTKLSLKMSNFSVENDTSNPTFENVILEDSCKNSTETKSPKKWKSLDSLKNRTNECGSETHSRSASPALSSGLENNSIKDAPIQIEVAQENIIVPEDDQKSVIAGGNVRGWLPDVAIILWKRMLGALGNVNDIADVNLHAQVFHHLIELSNTLIKMKLNQGVPEDNQKTPPVPELIPPLTIFSPWCFEALHLPPEYFKGKVYAYELLCRTTLAVPNSCLSRLYISKFYNVLQTGLTSTDKNIVYAIMKHTGLNFFSRQLPGYTLLILPFIQAAQTILLGDDLKQTPRAEAASVLVTLLSFPNVIMNFPSYKNKSNIAEELKIRILKILLHVAKKEQSGYARCIAVSGLGIYLMQEFERRSKHGYIERAFNTLLLTLKFKHEVVAQVACDVLSLLSNYMSTLVECYPEFPCKTIKVLVDTLSSMLPIGDGKKRLLTSLLLCLAEWAMSMPLDVLLRSDSENDQFQCLLFYVFGILEEISKGGRQPCLNLGNHFDDASLEEYIPTILLDDLKVDEYEARSFGDISMNLTHLNSTQHSLQLAAKMITAHLLTNLGQFPIISGATRLSSIVTEQDDNSCLTTNNLNMEIFSLPNLLMFVSTNNLILSLLELPALEVPGGGVTAGLVTASSQVRLLLRTLNGRFCWDASILYCTPEQLLSLEEEEPRALLLDEKKKSRADETQFVSYIASSPLQHTLRHRQPHILPTVENSASDLDNLDDLLQFIGHTSPECLEDPEMPRNVPSAHSPLNSEMEQETISTILNQKCVENDYLSHAMGLSPPMEHRPKYKDGKSSFQYSRLLLSHLGYLGWDMRSRLYLLQKTEKVLREIRNLDSQFCRETHKIAVIYVANGQEDKTSILSNTGGSQKYEDFIAALAWEVELESHTGFMGGLQRNRTTGVTAPYFASSFYELILHVSTRMSSSTPEGLINKTRHLGNDEVHIVWSEHNRDYRRGIIPTEFCDILIVIYPLPHNLYRLQISKKPEVPFFGPCFSETIVESSILPNLVRNIAVNASRAKRSMLPFHQQHYEERFRSLETIVRDYKTSSTFEDFSAQICFPTFSSTAQQSVLKSESKSGNVWQTGENADSTDLTPSISPKTLKKGNTKGGKRPAITGSLSTPPDSPTLRRSR